MIKVLLTGAFGNIGTSTVPELLKQGHVVRCFDLKTKTNQKSARKFAGQIEVVWGDIRQFDQVKEAVQGQQVVIHLAAIIPPLSEAQPDLAQTVNVGGTQNVIAALQAMPAPAKLIQASSLALFGRTQDKPPPRTINDSIYPTDHYTHHKAECEKNETLRFGKISRLGRPNQPDDFEQSPAGRRIHPELQAGGCGSVQRGTASLSGQSLFG